MSVSIPRSFYTLFFRKWLYVMLIIVQLLSTSVYVVSPWYVKTLEASFSFHITECSGRINMHIDMVPHVISAQ